MIAWARSSKTAMSSDTFPAKNYLSFDFILSPEDEDRDFDEGAIDRILDAFIDAVEKEGYCAGGGIGPPPPEERVCKKCEGIGIVDPIPEERKCPTCDGTGEIEVESMSLEEMLELYGDLDTLS